MYRSQRQTNQMLVFAAAIALVLAVAALFRFMNLSRAPLWMDEAFTVLAARLSPSEIAFNEIDNHPPLVYLIQSFWTDAFSKLSLTCVPAAAAGTLTVAIVIFTNWSLWSRAAAIWAGILLAVSTGHIYYSQDARLYPFLVLGLAGSTWGLIG